MSFITEAIIAIGKLIAAVVGWFRDQTLVRAGREQVNKENRDEIERRKEVAAEIDARPDLVDKHDLLDRL